MLLLYYWWTSRYQDSLLYNWSNDNRILSAMDSSNQTRLFQAVPVVFTLITKRIDSKLKKCKEFPIFGQLTKLSDKIFGILHASIENAIFSLEAEFDPKWLLWSISLLIRPSLNKILTDYLVTCLSMGNYFAFFNCKQSFDSL